MSRPTHSYTPTTVPPADHPQRALGERISRTDLTNDLMRTYDRVQAHIHVLEVENQRLRALIEGTDASSRTQHVDALKREKLELMTDDVTGGELATELTPSVASGLLAVRDAEAELSSLSNLLVASNWIHGSLTLAGVLQRLKDILEQLVGAHAYVVYISDEQALTPIAAEGLRPDEDPRLPPHLTRDVAHTGVSHITTSVSGKCGTLQDPIAAIPLTADQRHVGVLLIVRLLAHKSGLSDLDYEMFQLLGQHAATALVAAGLYAQAGQCLPKADAYHPAPLRKEDR